MNENLSIRPKTARIFFYLVLKYILPKNITLDQTERNESITLSDKESERNYFESLTFEIATLLKPSNFQIAYNGKTKAYPFNKEQSTYLVPFLVSKTIELKADDIIIHNSDNSAFEIKTNSLLLTQKILEKSIRDALCAKLAIHELVFTMATSRSFIFEIYYAGTFIVKRVFSDVEIESVGGIKDVLESFFDDIESLIEPSGFTVNRESPTHRRNLNNEYSFEVAYTAYIGFGEGNVNGDGCYAVRGDASADEIREYSIDFSDVCSTETNELLISTLDECLPYDVELVSSNIIYVDDPEELFDIRENLIFSKK